MIDLCVGIFGVVFDLCLCCVFVCAWLMPCSLVVAIVVQVFGILVHCLCLAVLLILRLFCDCVDCLCVFG